VWIWAVPAYFYAGGVAGASAILAAAAGRLGGDDTENLVVRARWIAAVSGGAGSVLLIHDLGRPRRFLHMLRVFRPTSPMSVGSWIMQLRRPSSGEPLSSLVRAGPRGGWGGYWGPPARLLVFL